MADSYGKGDRGKATYLHAVIVRGRGRCEAAGQYGAACTGELECAHIVGRRYGMTRTDEANALCLCKGHHARFTDDDFGWVDFCRGYLGEAECDRLWTKARSNNGTLNKAWWSDELERLRWLAVGLGLEDEAVRRGLITKRWVTENL